MPCILERNGSDGNESLLYMTYMYILINNQDLLKGSECCGIIPETNLVELLRWLLGQLYFLAFFVCFFVCLFVCLLCFDFFFFFRNIKISRDGHFENQCCSIIMTSRGMIVQLLNFLLRTIFGFQAFRYNPYMARWRESSGTGLARWLQ